MRVSALALAALTLSATITNAFVVPSFARPASKSLKSAKLHEFDHLLQEGEHIANAVTKTTLHRVVIPGSPDDSRAIQMTSTQRAATFPGAPSMDNDIEEAEEDVDEYGDMYTEQLNKIQEYESERKGFNLNEYLKNSDMGDIIVTLAIPSVIALVGLRFVYGKVFNFLEEKADVTLVSFAKEMIYHDGDFEEMKMCKDDYARRLAWMGPKRNDIMLKRYLEVYAKKKTVSPQSISSLSFVFTLFNLSEEKAADTLVALCRQMGTDKISSAGKLLFFGSRILKSPEGKAALIPIKNMIKSTYRDEDVAETLVETSQQAIGEAAYRAAVQAGGKNQKKLTLGWEVLGLDEDTAKRIFTEEAEEGFATYRETMYGGQTTKYDKKGNIIDKEGKLVDPENAEKDNEPEEDDSASGNVFECGNCGYTMFVAKGRDFKFFGDDFKCPECGAGKDQFESRTIEED